MTGPELRTIRKRNHLSQQQLAEMLGYRYFVSISRMETGKIPIPDTVSRFVELLFEDKQPTTRPR
jgi:transcriptional regulator with XRE-family HTH domain